MDKYEFNIKVEQIKKLVNRGDYVTAMKIADTIDWHRVRNASLLSMVAQVYEKNEEYQEAKDILLLAFERAPIGKRLLYKLTDLAIKEGSIAEAEAYYREFCELAQDDPRQYLLRYLILKAKKAPVDQLIRSLEMYTSTEVDEKWMYELAELYHDAGMDEKCVSTCDTIMLLFGLGKYVDKAMDLKLEYAPLNKYQMDLVENRDKYEAKLRAVEEEYAGPASRKGSAADAQVQEPEEEPELADDEAFRIHEEEQTEKLAKEVAKISEEELPLSTEDEDDLEPTRTLDDLKAIRGRKIAPCAPSEESAQDAEAEHEIERQRAAIRAAKEREEMEAEALRRAEEEREAARREEEERRVRKQAEIDRERAAHERELREQVLLARDKENQEDEDLEIESLDDEPETNHLMIEAKSDEEGLSMALDALRKIHKELGCKNPVAKISSEKLNKRGISAVAEKLVGKDLIVEHAAGLTIGVQNELDDLMEKDKSGMIVVLIDTPDNLEALHAHNTSLAGKFQYIGENKELAENIEAEEAEEEAVEEALQKEIAVQEKIARETAATEEPPMPEEEPEEEEIPEEEPPKTVKKPERKPEVRQELKPEKEAEKAQNVRPEPAPAAKRPEQNPVQAVKPDEELSAEEYDDATEMDIDEFAQYACKYASEIDCSITGKSMLALYERIEMIEEDGVRLTKKAAVDLIEDAADKAEKKTLGKKLTGLFSPTYDKDGYLILREKDFFD